MANRYYSVIIAAQNAADTIRWAVASVLAYNPHDFELVLVDDDSNDDTLNIMLEIAAMDWRIKVLAQPRGGYAKSCNYGAIMARGEWLVFLDPNEVWAGDKLTRLVAAEQLAPNVCATFERTTAFKGQKWVHPDQATLALCSQNGRNKPGEWTQRVGQSVSNLAVKRKVFEKCGGFDETLQESEFEDLLTRLELAGHLVICQSGEEHKRTPQTIAKKRQGYKSASLN